MRAGSEQREIGPVGTAARIVGGVALLAVAVLPGGLTIWDAVGGVVAGPLIALAVAAAVRAAAARAGLADRTPWSAPSLATLGLVIAGLTALTFLTPLDQPAIWVFLGASTLVAAARGQAGCEILAISNALTRREDRIGCVVYGPFDAADPPASTSRR